MGVLIASSACGFALLGGVAVSEQERFVASSIRTFGHVMPPDHTIRSGKPTQRASPISKAYSFTARDGRSYRLVPAFGMPRIIALLSAADRVEILYREDNPTTAKLNTWATLWLGAALCFLVSGCTLALGFALVLHPSFGVKMLVWIGTPVTLGSKMLRMAVGHWLSGHGAAAEASGICAEARDAQLAQAETAAIAEKEAVARDVAEARRIIAEVQALEVAEGRRN